MRAAIVGLDRATMRTVVQQQYGSADMLQVRTIDRSVRSDNEVLVIAAGVNPEISVRAGLPRSPSP